MRESVGGFMIDTHAHLNEVEHIDQAIRRARDVGIEGIVAVGTEVASNRITLELAKKFTGMVHPAIGFHPWSIASESIEENLVYLEENLNQCIALGEVGIDYKTKVKKPVQWEVFSKVLSMAVQRERPVIVHSRFSHQRTHQMVRDSGIERAVFHWYNGSLEILEKIVEDGHYVSATPALMYSPPHQMAIKAAPLERILVETDCPVAYQEKASEPADLTITLERLSHLKGKHIDEVRRVTTNNAKHFFGL